jgi:hypothetical protein
MATSGTLIKDKSQTAVQVGNAFVTADGTATPVTSPLTMSGIVQTLVVPNGAIDVVFHPTANAVSISENIAMSQYYNVAGGAFETFHCAKMTTIYVKGTAADTLSFRFRIV